MWDAVRRHLTEADVRSVAVEVPMTDLAADVSATRRALDEVDAPVVLVGHSYGGAVITEAGAHPHVSPAVHRGPASWPKANRSGARYPTCRFHRLVLATGCASPMTTGST
jgi:pimeloyl-ACP methyl ester carboxylesterase